jgi:RNA polymerase sigma-70 factor, ECF subfamily
MNTAQDDYLKQRIIWEETTDPEYPYSARINQDNYLIRLNDFPAESLYTLIVNNEEVEDLEDWPVRWIRPSQTQDQRAEQTEKVRKDIAHEPEPILVARPKGTRPKESELAALVSGIVARNPRSEEEIVRRYADGIYHIVYRVVHNHSVAEDLCQETWMKVLEKIRHGDVREPERLSGFILAIARSTAVNYIRKMRGATQEAIEKADQTASLAEDQYEQLWQKERDKIVRQVISELKVKRDRDILFRYYILEEEKEEICARLGLTREQFKRVFFRLIRRMHDYNSRIA